MWITPRISFPLSNCLMLPTNWFSIELSFSGTHPVTLGLLGYSLTDGDGPAGLCRLSLFEHIYPSARHTYNRALCRAQQQAPQSQTTVCRSWNPRGLNERTTSSFHLLQLYDTVACTGTITSSCIIDTTGNSNHSEQQGSIHHRNIQWETVSTPYAPHVSAGSPGTAEISRWIGCWDWSTWYKANF